jgi:hypothetical protein
MVRHHGDEVLPAVPIVDQGIQRGNDGIRGEVGKEQRARLVGVPDERRTGKLSRPEPAIGFPQIVQIRQCACSSTTPSVAATSAP